jgi:hypothetical protein
MADDYTVELQGHTFSVGTPRVRWSAVAQHREDAVPLVLSVWTYTIELEGCRVRTTDGTPDKAQEALGAFLTATIHKAVVPTYLKILDSASQPIDEIGAIQPGTNGWEDLRVVSWKIDPGEEQMLAGVEFSVTLRARKVFADTNGLVFARRRFASVVGADGLEVRTLTAEIRMAAGTSVPLTAAWLLALVRLPAPAGWVCPSGGARGFDVRYPNRYGLTDEAEFSSVVKQVGGGVIPPTRAGGGTEGVARRLVPELGLVRVTTSAQTVGTESSTDWVDARRPSGAIGERTTDKGGRDARGSWEAWEAAATLGGRVNVVSADRELVPGGRDLTEALLTGGILGPLRIGPARRWQMIERIVVSALGPKEFADLPTLPLLGEPWALVATGTRDGWHIAERAADARRDLHRWQRTTTRLWWWDREGDPRDDADTKKLLLRSYDAGEEGLVLS